MRKYLLVLLTVCLFSLAAASEIDDLVDEEEYDEVDHMVDEDKEDGEVADIEDRITLPSILTGQQMAMKKINMALSCVNDCFNAKRTMPPKRPTPTNGNGKKRPTPTNGNGKKRPTPTNGNGKKRPTPTNGNGKKRPTTGKGRGKRPKKVRNPKGKKRPKQVKKPKKANGRSDDVGDMEEEDEDVEVAKVEERAAKPTAQQMMMKQMWMTYVCAKACFKKVMPTNGKKPNNV